MKITAFRPKCSTRPPGGATIYPFPFGFNPQEASDEDDYQFNLGVKGSIASWDWDLATGYGSDQVGVSTIDSYNAGTYNTTGIPTPTNFDDGSLISTQWTSNLDFKRDFNIGLAGPLDGGIRRANTVARPMKSRPACRSPMSRAARNPIPDSRRWMPRRTIEATTFDLRRSGNASPSMACAWMARRATSTTATLAMPPSAS